uniref:Solute carrier family 14 member 2 n=1 Tax=Myotis myotis TaxID=51298 RepID=A0A7J7W173_MYOMY|nr:solute carrier family 14 member 2 [Myotis myotis]
MEESAEIKVDTSISRTSRMQSYLAAGGKRISSALSYVTGEMKECGEGLKDKSPVFQFLDWVLRGTSQVMFVNNPLSGANLPAPDDQQPCHLQASAQQSHLPRGQPDLLPVPGEEQKTINHNKVPGL